MPDNKNNNSNKNNVRSINESVVVNDGNHLIHSLQTDSSDFAPPPVSKLNGNTTNTTDNNNNENK